MELISRTTLADMLGISTRTLDRVDSLPAGFPDKIKITQRRVGYDLRDVHSWLLQQRATSLVGGGV